ncbi:MAG TPA: hypothetical protein VM557_03050 [Thermoanaerobaculia bacterium]|nr:hypothetical protein [Thermoanaerobaculia bacterium]
MESIWIIVIGVIVIAGLVWFLLKKMSKDKIDQRIRRKQAGSKFVASADFVEANTRIPVVLGLTDRQIFYENDDLEGSLDLGQIEEVEYGSELYTGQEVANGRVLRLRSHGRSIEFVLDKATSEKFESHLPPHRADEPGKVYSV